jgi:chemotaxis protein MotB
MASKQPIIIIKKVSGHGGHHGGAWKVAYADFVTAMMALFIVLWLLNSSVKVKKAVAGYFNDPLSSHKETGSDKVGNDDSIPIDKQSVEKLKEQIQKAIKEQPDLLKLAKQIEITITPEGLRIELIEQKNGTFFQSGSAKLSESGQQLLNMLAGQLKPLPNKLLLEGHTDAQPYSTDNGYTNWELSADRANSARRLLQQDGVGQSQISQVRGYADQLLRVKNDPLDPSNRRISLIVQWVELPAAPGATTEGGKDAKAGEAGKNGPGKAATPVPSPAKPAAGSTAAAAPAKAGFLDGLKKMLPGGNPTKK